MDYDDSYGWYSPVDCGRREIPVPPPSHGEKIVGQPYPNWSGSEWVMKVYTTPPSYTQADAPEDWYIDEGPFKDRLGMDALAIAASDDGICKAVVQMLNNRKFIDLKGAKVAQLLGLLILNNQPAVDARFPGSGPMTTGKVFAILSVKPNDSERHRG